MGERNPPLLVYPKCGEWGLIDDDQLHGRVSVICPNAACDFHETRDWTSPENRAEQARLLGREVDPEIAPTACQPLAPLTKQKCAVCR